MELKTYNSIDEIYADLPEVECAGKCATQCSTAIVTSMAEQQTIAVETGVTIPYVTLHRFVERDLKIPSGICPALTDDKRCGVHPVRPLICRLYGLLNDGPIQCPHGCKIIGEPLSEDVAHHMLREAYRIGGGSTVLRKSKEQESQQIVEIVKRLVPEE